MTTALITNSSLGHGASLHKPLLPQMLTRDKETFFQSRYEN